MSTTGTPRDALAPYPWSRSVKTSNWLRAKETEISAAQWPKDSARTEN